MTIHNPMLLPKVRSMSLRRSIATMPCALRISNFIPGHGCSHQVTVVGAHAPTIGKGTGTKVSDLFLCAACSNCHDLLDGRDQRWWWLMEKYPAAVMQRVLDGLAETQSRWAGMGLITGEDWEIK